MSDEIIIEDSIFRIGKVISVDGRIIKVSVEPGNGIKGL
jgi:hypothetical protein